ncbi:MAG: type VI secretion system ImpA family N-terminal domain-containing protein [Holosporales bacterium]|jgi:type VI secretion system protein ImpA|nr:type VI secretion system ImpA family N-terminal domain-containing protein [Holosporales bacterium]
MNRANYSISDLFNNIENSSDICGKDLSLSQIYDDIKNAKYEEDDRLSLGVWERELKKAEWQLVEQLCVDALINQSKDLQIVGWLMEALAVLDGFEGICKGIEILDEFTKIYWKDCYPKNEDNESDDEQKLKILDWIYETINKRAISIPFVNNNGISISIYNYDYAIEMKTILIRAPDRAKEIQESIEKNNIKTLEMIQNIMKSLDKDYLKSIIECLDRLKHKTDELEKNLRKLFNNDTVTVFSKLISNVNKLKKFITQYITDIPENSGNLIKNHKEYANIPTSSTREQIYDQIAQLAQQLQEIEKHSPSHYMLELVVSWKNKTLLAIINDLKSGTSEAHELLKILLNS